jgi:hypothetical protein
MLTFMFLFNMIGALVLIPALSHFLLANVTATAKPRPDQTPLVKRNQKEYV